jgi:hypothetical protein
MFMGAYGLLMFFWVPVDTTVVWDEAGQATRVRSEHYPSPTWIWVTRVLHGPAVLFLVVYLLDAPLFDIGEFAPVWSMLAYLGLGVYMGVAALVVFMFVNAEPEVATAVQGTSYAPVRNELSGSTQSSAAAVHHPVASSLAANTRTQPQPVNSQLSYAQSVNSRLGSTATTPAAAYSPAAQSATL